MVQFTRKKIDSLTLGERMKKLRDERRLSLGEISKGTKIQTKYLQYFEESEYMKLPADVYVKGFLRSYGLYMGISEISLIKQFEREKGIHKNIKKIVDEDKIKKPINFSIFVITPKMIIVGIILLAVFSSFIYLYLQVNNFISTPRLIIVKPTDSLVVEGSSTRVVGMAEKNALVTINDQPVLVNEKGEFSEDIGLKEGVNVIAIKARNKFNKEATQAVSVNAVFPALQGQQQSSSSQQNPEQGQQASLVSAEVSVSPNSTWLSVEADGNLVYSGVLLPESVQKFDAREKISISSGKGKETFVKINGKDLGQLSATSAPAKDIVFDVNGRVLNK
jgi:cytoskeletal protein RodZ